MQDLEVNGYTDVPLEGSALAIANRVSNIGSRVFPIISDIITMLELYLF